MNKEQFKQIFNNKYIIKIISWISHFYIYLIYKTSKIIIKGDYQTIIDYIGTGKGMVLITWHGRSILAPVELKRLFKKEIKKGKKISVLSSSHRDGKIAGSIMSTFNIDVIEGSTINPKKGSIKNKKSLTSIRTTMKALLDGEICVLAPDGPRGPAFKMNTKITDIVQKTNTAIACVSASYKRKKELKTWDRLQIAFPFNKIIIEYGKLIEISKNDNIENINLELEAKLNEITKKNDLNINL